MTLVDDLLLRRTRSSSYSANISNKNDWSKGSNDESSKDIPSKFNSKIKTNMSSEYERKLIDMQYQMRENNAFLDDYLKDLDSWTNDMKKKEEILKKAEDTMTTASKDLPPIRNFVEPPKPKKKIKKKTMNSKNSSAIRSYDYRSWDKFDVDAECERIDEESPENQDGDDEMDDEQWQEEVLKQKGEHYKKWGNHHFEKKSYAEAIECYTKAIECNPTVAVYFANRAQCQLIEQRYGACEADCTLAIQLDGNYLKAYYRRALARVQLEKFEKARQDLEHILSRDPNNKDAKVQLDELNRKDEIKRLGRVYPLKDKPLEQRSKKPLKRIEIQEIDTSMIAVSETKKKTNLVIEEIENTPTSVPPAPAPIEAPIPIPVKPKTTEKPPAKPVSIPTSIPTSGFQFKRDWTSLNQHLEQQAIYFDRIPPTSYGKLFATGIDASVFSRILLFWSEKTSLDEQMLDSMCELSRTPRFDTQLSFLGSEEKKILKTILERLETIESLSAEKLSKIKKAYKVD